MRKNINVLVLVVVIGSLLIGCTKEVVIIVQNGTSQSVELVYGEGGVILANESVEVNLPMD